LVHSILVHRDYPAVGVDPPVNARHCMLAIVAARVIGISASPVVSVQVDAVLPGVKRKTVVFADAVPLHLAHSSAIPELLAI